MKLCTEKYLMADMICSYKTVIYTHNNIYICSYKAVWLLLLFIALMHQLYFTYNNILLLLAYDNNNKLHYIKTCLHSYNYIQK